MNSVVLVGYLLAVFAFLVLPGPVSMAVVNASVNSGLKTAMFVIVGANLASLILIFISSMIISGLLSVNQELINCVSIVGGRI